MEIYDKMTKSNKIIAIIGLMGVGKSTIGSKLAEEMGCYFADCDQEIEDRMAMSIAEIFAQKGEQYFRSIEKDVVKEIVDRDERMVISLGGGAFDDPQSRDLLLEKCYVVWLKASIDDIIHRIGNKSNRPLLNNGNKREVLENLIAKRYPNYSNAHIEIDTSKISHEEVVDAIITQVNYEKS